MAYSVKAYSISQHNLCFHHQQPSSQSCRFGCTEPFSALPH